MDNCGNITKPKARVYNYLAKLGLLKELPKTISDDTVFFPRNFLLNDKKGYLFTTSEGNIVFEPGKKTPMTWETFVNKDLIASLFKTYGMVLPEDTKIVEFVYPAEGKTKYIDSYVKFNEDILSRIKRFGYEYPQELVPPQMEESNKLEPDDFTEQNSPDLSLEKQPTTTQEIKPGIQELFDSSPELANQVYETLGFDSKSIYYQFEPNKPYQEIGNIVRLTPITEEVFNKTKEEYNQKTYKDFLNKVKEIQNKETEDNLQIGEGFPTMEETSKDNGKTWKFTKMRGDEWFKVYYQTRIDKGWAKIIDKIKSLKAFKFEIFCRHAKEILVDKKVEYEVP
jgi:hypothetical protein